MAVALSRDRLSLNDTQLQEISAQIRLGDLTPVLQVYEEDIKSPIKSAVKGTLIRSLLVQIQKAKVWTVSSFQLVSAFNNHSG